MKSIVINLKSRKDRLDAFGENNKGFLNAVQVYEAVDGSTLDYEKLLKIGFDTDKNWRDPLLGRTMTRGEVACFLSHYKLWQLVAEGDEPVAIFEDDVQCFQSLDSVLPLLGDHEFMFLVHSEQKKEGVEDLSVDLVKPCYPYWLAAYVITPSAAKKLISTDIYANIIPCDEYVPRMTDKIDMVALSSPMCRQIGRADMGSNIEPQTEVDYLRDFTTHVLTCGNSDERMEAYAESAKRLGVPYRNILTREWKGSDMIGPGGGQKLNELKAHLASIPDHDVVLFTDAFDVFFVRGVHEIVGRFLGFKSEIVFSAEKNLWPDPSLRFPPTHTSFRYLNSGTFIGRVGEVKRMLEKELSDSCDDQLYLQKEYLTGKYSATLDTEGYIFQTHDEETVVRSGALYNTETLCFPCIYHGNGGDAAKGHFTKLYQGIHPPMNYQYVSYDQYEVIANEMLLIDFLSPEQCREWIEMGDRHNGWQPDAADKFPSYDIHMKLIPGLWEQVEQHWRKVIARVTDNYWRPSAHYQLRKAFLMRYSLDTQKTLGLHNDASLVTGSVKLNDDYEGATLIFPRQGLTNKDIPVGKMILFPGQLTHGHYVDELKSGVKYSATFWTGRYKGDVYDPS